MIAENTARSNKISYPSRRWIEIEEPPKVKETRSAEEIISDFKKRLNKKEGGH